MTIPFSALSEPHTIACGGHIWPSREGKGAQPWAHHLPGLCAFLRYQAYPPISLQAMGEEAICAVKTSNTN